MSDHTGPYDPNAVEGDRSASGQYVTVKDVKIWAIALVVLGIAAYPIYRELLGQSERARCGVNMRAVFQAINLYADQHDNRFPPIARTEADGITPSLAEDGRPYTWISDVAPFMNARQSFLCPTATDAEKVRNESGESVKKSVVSSYGMYAPYGGVLTSLVENPDDAILVAETCDAGARSTLDTAPFGKGVPDGFSIGWSDGNAVPSKSTASVSRLAFPNMAAGKTDEGRHGKFIWGLSASGELRQLLPDDAAYRLPGVGGINPHWKLPPGYHAAGH